MGYFEEEGKHTGFMTLNCQLYTLKLNVVSHMDSYSFNKITLFSILISKRILTS